MVDNFKEINVEHLNINAKFGITKEELIIPYKKSKVVFNKGHVIHHTY